MEEEIIDSESNTKKRNKKSIYAIIYRINVILGMLRANKYPNTQTILEEISRHRGENISDSEYSECCDRTIRRDIGFLRENYGDLIVYDREKQGYYLKDQRDIEFAEPLLTKNDNNELIAAVVYAANLVKDIVPEPLRSQIQRGANVLLETKPDFLDTTNFGLFKSSSALGVNIEPSVFETIKKCWETHKTVKIYYKDIFSSRNFTVDPYVLTFYDSIWYMKGYWHEDQRVKTFAIHKILKSENTGDCFGEIPAKILKAPGNEFPFDVELINDIDIWCAPEVSLFVHDQQDASIWKHASKNEDGSITLHINHAFKQVVIQWVLGQGGKARVLRPESLVNEIKAEAKKIYAEHQ